MKQSTVKLDQGHRNSDTFINIYENIDVVIQDKLQESTFHLKLGVLLSN